MWTMPQTSLHRDLVASLVSHLAAENCVVTRAAGVGTLPDPEKIGRHEPDVLAEADGQLIIGEAKVGPDLHEDTSQEQLTDFSTHIGPNGEWATFWLCVPDGWREEAREAISDAGGTLHDRVDILTVSGLRGVILPPDAESNRGGS
jgi:hypothetical protein